MDKPKLAKQRGAVYARKNPVKYPRKILRYEKKVVPLQPDRFVFRNTETFVLACVVKRGRFFCFFFPFLCCKTYKKYAKMQKNEKKCKKIAKKFAHIKKKLYLCTEFEKQPNK